MKTWNKVVLAVCALMATFTSAQAANVTLHISGSTAYRSAVHNAISHILTSPVAAYNGTTLSTANQAVFQGTIAGVTGTVTIETNWTGSVSGIAAIANNTSIPGFNLTTTGYSSGYGWMSASNIPGSGAGVTAGGQSGFSSSFGLSAGPGGGVQISPGSIVADSASTADVGFADCYQSSTPYSVAKGYPNVEGSTGNTLSIIPNVFVKNCANTADTDYATWQRMTNLTGLQARFLYANGAASANFVTGNASDACNIIALGLDTDSGTRLDALAESSIGQYTSIQQFFLNITGGNSNAGVTGTVTSSASTQAGSSLTATLSPGAGGESAGTTLALKMATPGSDASDLGGYGIAYLNVADADGLLSPSGTAPSGYKAGAYLTFDGVACSLANISNGTYQLWDYEHYLLRPSGDSPLQGDQLTVSTALQAQLINTDAAVAGFKLSQVGATKTVEGGVITPP